MQNLPPDISREAVGEKLGTDPRKHAHTEVNARLAVQEASAINCESVGLATRWCEIS
jgi:hypothetical protein